MTAAPPTATDLVITSRAGETLALSTLRGKVAIVAFISKAACHTGPVMEIIDQLWLEIGASQFAAVGCVVDLERGEQFREYGPFMVPLGAAPRRAVADYLKVSMSGFGVPQFILLDRSGKQRFLLGVPRGDEFLEMVDNIRKLVDLLLDEGSPAGANS